MLRRLVTELIEPLDKQMTGQNGNGTEEVEANDLNKEDSKLAASYQSVEDFEGPGPTGQNENETEEVGANDLNKEDRKLAASYQSVEDFLSSLFKSFASTSSVPFSLFCPIICLSRGSTSSVTSRRSILSN